MKSRSPKKEPRLPTKLKDRYAALENMKKLQELNEHRRRKMAVREALNHHLELERLKGLVSSQRISSLQHVAPRIIQLGRMIAKVQKGEYT
jgi:hypothetical protein